MCHDATWPGFCIIFFAPKKLFPLSGFSVHARKRRERERQLQLQGRAYLPLPNLVELQGDMLS